MMPVPVMSAPAGAMAVPSVPVMRPRLVSPPVMSMSMMPVPVMRRVDPRTCEGHDGHRDEERQAGDEESEKSIP